MGGFLLLSQLASLVQRILQALRVQLCTLTSTIPLGDLRSPVQCSLQTGKRMLPLVLPAFPLLCVLKDRCRLWPWMPEMLLTYLPP